MGLYVRCIRTNINGITYRPPKGHLIPFYYRITLGINNAGNQLRITESLQNLTGK